MPLSVTVIPPQRGGNATKSGDAAPESAPGQHSAGRSLTDPGQALPHQGPTTSGSVSLGDFFALLWRRVITFLVCFVVVFLVALALLANASRTYNAESTIKVTPVTALGDNPTKGISTVTESRIATSTQVAAIAAKTLGYNGRIDDLLANVSASSPLDSQLIYVTFSGDSAKAAADGANAFADGYLAYRSRVAQANLADQAKKVAAQIDTLQRELSSTSTSSSSPRQRSVLQSQIDSLNNNLYTINTTLVTPGQVVGTAQPPISPSSPRAILYVAGGLLGGIIIGIVAAVVRDRRDDGVHGEGDLSNAINAPVLATVSPSDAATSTDLTFGPAGDTARRAAVDAYRVTATKMRSLVREPASQRFLLTRAGRTTRPHAAVYLAAMFARQGRQTVLVITDASTAVVEPFLGDEKAPTSLDDGLRQVPDVEGLSVLALGLEDEIDSVLNVRADEIATALERADVVVVDAINVDHVSSVLTLERLASSAVVTAVNRRTTHADLNRITSELAQVGAYPLGGMLFARDSTATRVLNRLRRGSHTKA